MMAISRRLCVASTVLSVLVLAVVVGLCVWFAVPHNCNDDNKPHPTPNPDPPADFNGGLLIQKYHEIELKTINKIKDETITLVKRPFLAISAVDYYRNKTVYYSSFGDPITPVSKEYPKIMPFNDKWWASAFAIDIISKNFYIYDEDGQKMYVIDAENKHRGIIFSDLSGVKDIAINPFRRWIFMLTKSSIFMADMDGEKYEEIVNDNDIEAFALNLIGPYVYWATKNQIMSLYVGMNTVNVATAPTTIKALAVFDKDLYFISDAPDGSTELYSCGLDLNDVCSGEFNKLESQNPLRIKVYVPHLWEDTPNPCDYQNGGCEHLCLLKADDETGRRGACSIGWQLNVDAQTCSPIDEYIMYINSFTLRGRIPDRGSDRSFVDAIPPRRLTLNTVQEDAVEFDFDWHRRLVIYRDQYNIYLLDLQAHKKDTMIGTDGTSAMYPVIDWIAKENLYYLKASRRSEYESYIMLRGYSKFNTNKENEKEIYKFEKTQHPRAMVIEPNHGYLFVTVYEDSLKVSRIYKIVADGSTSMIFDAHNDHFTVNETGLGIDYNQERLYWFSEDLSTVQYANYDGSDFKSFDISFMKEPKGLNVHKQWLYVSSLEATWRVDKIAGQQSQQILSFTTLNNYGLSAAKGFGPNIQLIRIDHPCAVDNGGCGRYCIAVPQTNTGSLRRVCACNDNEQLEADDKKCTFIPKFRF